MNIKIIGRIKPVFGNTLSLVLPSLTNLLLSLLVIRLYNVEWWGKIVEMQIIYYLATNLTGWGNKEYLIREFSKTPSKIKSIWGSSFNSRFLYILVPVSILLFIYDHSFSGLYLLSWIILRHIQQSFESLSTFEKRFTPLIASELMSLLFLIVSLYYFKSSGFETILLLITISYLIRTLIVVITFKNYFSVSSEIKITTLSAAFTFMLLAFTNIAQSKSDILVMNMLLDKTELAKYGVITSFIFLSRSATTFLVYPFAKNIYRLKKSSIRLLSIEFLKYGLGISILGVAFQYIMLNYFYHFQCSFSVYILSIICIFPSFWYSPIVYFLFKKNKQLKVIYTNAFGIIMNVIACFIFIKFYGINGGLISMAIAQLFMFILLYYYFIKTIDHEH